MEGNFFFPFSNCCSVFGLVLSFLNISVMLPDIDFGWPVDTLWLVNGCPLKRKC